MDRLRKGPRISLNILEVGRRVQSYAAFVPADEVTAKHHPVAKLLLTTPDIPPRLIRRKAQRLSRPSRIVLHQLALDDDPFGRRRWEELGGVERRAVDDLGMR